jgi:phosphatidylglycerophosphate synthase
MTGTRHSSVFGSIPGERPAELHGFLNRRLYHPLARALARRLVPTFVTPNMVSLVGGGFVVAAAIVYIQPGWPLPALFGLLLHMIWHVVDGADGDLARMTGKSSVRGELIDGICDYTSHIILYLVLASVMAHEIGPVAWAIIVAAGISHIIQANHFEVARRQYQWWVYGVVWMQNKRDEIAPRSGMGAIIAGYLALAGKLATRERGIEDAVVAAGADHDRLAKIRNIVREGYARPLSASSLLGANHRTITLGLSMLAGSPLYHMIYQIVGLNALLIWSLAVRRRAVSHIMAQLDVQAPDDKRRAFGAQIPSN